MPNWCFQYAQVDGEVEDIQEFIDAIRVTPASVDLNDDTDKWNINQLHPTPEPLMRAIKGSGADAESEENMRLMQENEDEFGFRTWYDWRHENWGTKWGACHIQLDEDEFKEINENGTSRPSLMFSFESAWSPAVQLMQKVSAKFPKLIFGIYFTEEANFFAGYCVFHNGNIVKDYETPAEVMKEQEDLEDDSQWFHDLVSGLENGMDQTMLEHAKKLKDGSAQVM